MPSMNQPGRTNASCPTALRDVDLERVRDLVAEHVVGLAEAGGKRHRDARLGPLGQAAGALAGDDGVTLVCAKCGWLA